MRDALDGDASIRSLMNRPVEAWALAPGRLVSCTTEHAFASAAHDAFYHHMPLRIRPDDIWFCIAQGFATHVNENVESLRERFVQHEGKQTLVVERPDFQIGKTNPWPEAFAEFSSQVGAHVGKLHDLVSGEFSTTTNIEKAAFDVAVMDTFQGYFEYVMMAGCGIPEITLEGTPEDWRSIITRTRYLSEYGLEPWTDALLPVLERIAATAEGESDLDFWRSFFRYQSGSGPPELTGWILTLFPYIKGLENDALQWNQYLKDWREGWARAEARKDLFPQWDAIEGPGIHRLPSSHVSAPVRYVQLPEETEYPLRFVAGMLGVHQDETSGELRPAFGWAVIHEED